MKKEIGYALLSYTEGNNSKIYALTKATNRKMARIKFEEANVFKNESYKDFLEANSYLELQSKPSIKIELEHFIEMGIYPKIV